MRNTKKVTKSIRGAGRKLSSTPAAIASRHYRLIMKESRERARVARNARKTSKILRGMHEAIREPCGLNLDEDRHVDAILDNHFRKGHWNDLDYPRSADDDMPTTEAPATAVASLEDTIFSDDVMHDAGIPSDAHAVLHGPYATAADIEKAHGDGFVDQPELTEGGPAAAWVEAYLQRRRDRSEVVAEMVRRRNAPRGFTDPRVNEADPPAYSVATQDAAKMRELITQDQERNRQFLVTENGKARECLTECAKIMAGAIDRFGMVMAGKALQNVDNSPYADDGGRPWSLVGSGMPLNCWLETCRGTDAGTNEAMCLLRAIGDELEWVDRDGRTTVTHSTFLPPTHWRWPVSGVNGSGLTTTYEDTLVGLRKAGYNCEMRK